MSDYDVLVVGAGPVGSTFARYMAKKGFKVGVLEKKKKIGVPLQCAGLLAKKVKKVNVLPDEFIINKVRGAFIHSPSDNILKVSKKEPEAFVLDRVAYDQHLAELAQSEGAEILFQHNVGSVDVDSGRVKLSNNGKLELTADVVVGAGGHNSVVSSLVNQDSKKFEAAQYLVEFKKPILDDDFVDLHVKSDISPGFIWTIPISSSTARIGLFGKQNYHILNKYLEEHMKSNYKSDDFNILKKYHGFIPISDSKKTLYKGRSILIGDAASQVKPTTGGGLVIGFAAAKMACESVSSAIENNDPSLLKNYELNYHKMFDKELKNQFRVQKTFEMLTDDDFDQMFLKLKEKGAEEIISKYGDMDDQSPLIKEFIKRGLILSIVPSFLSRRVSKIWNFF